MNRQACLVAVLLCTSCGSSVDVELASGGNVSQAVSSKISVDILVDELSDAHLSTLAELGKVSNVLYEINALSLKTTLGNLDTIEALPFVLAVSPDAERKGIPIDTVAAEDFSGGLSTWDLDAINVTDYGFANRKVEQDGEGVYVAVLDTGLVDMWRQYFPEERIATEYATAFDGADQGVVASVPNKWEHDADSHGTHVTSTILGYNMNGTAINGVAPRATVIPVKVLNQNGSGWSSMVAAGIVYVADLKAGPLADHPVVINMSLGGPNLDAMEQAAIDYAVSAGVIVVASAGNSGRAGMGYPGAYEPVISVAASGWTGEWTAGGWWNAVNVGDPTDAADFYIADFSSRALEGQDLDISAPGSWVVGPYQVNNGQTSYYYLGGTSMASPHVAGTVALMAQKSPGLTASEAEAVLEGTAIFLPAGCRTVAGPSGVGEVCWEGDATGAGLLDAQAALAAVMP